MMAEIDNEIQKLYQVFVENESSDYELWTCLTHISLFVILWDIGKQHSPGCEAAERGVPSGAILFAYRKFLKKKGIKIQNHSQCPSK